MRPVPDSNFSCWKVVANRALAPHLDYVEYDASLFGCRVCHILAGGAIWLLQLQKGMLTKLAKGPVAEQFQSRSRRH